jgi:hypothetical protein
MNHVMAPRQGILVSQFSLGSNNTSISTVNELFCLREAIISHSEGHLTNKTIFIDMNVYDTSKLPLVSYNIVVLMITMSSICIFLLGLVHLVLS